MNVKRGMGVRPTYRTALAADPRLLLIDEGILAVNCANLVPTVDDLVGGAHVAGPAGGKADGHDHVAGGDEMLAGFLYTARRQHATDVNEHHDKLVVAVAVA